MRELYKKRLSLLGIKSQHSFSELIECTPAQLSIFLRGKGNLSVKELTRANEVLGIDINAYSKRFDFTYRIAEELRKKSIPAEAAIYLTKEQISSISGQSKVLLFLDVPKTKFKETVESGMIDIESTFAFFKAVIIYLLACDLIFNTPKYRDSWKKISKITGKDFIETGGLKRLIKLAEHLS